ncbi:hypothetical protein EV127DRAFT_480085 [Xylaria flabelliformis]|nr:hypothetical protein EV127DRAFT_480085 [Xylaria flabelliformis]
MTNKLWVVKIFTTYTLLCQRKIVLRVVTKAYFYEVFEHQRNQKRASVARLTNLVEGNLQCADYIIAPVHTSDKFDHWSLDERENGLFILYGGQYGGLPSHGPNGSRNPYSLLPEILKVDPKFHPNAGVAKFRSRFPYWKENWSAEVKAAIRTAYNHPDVEPHLKHASLSELRMLVIHPTIAKNLVNFDAYKLPARDRSMVQTVPDCWDHIEKMGLYADIAILPADIKGPERPQNTPTREARRADPFPHTNTALAWVSAPSSWRELSRHLVNLLVVRPYACPLHVRGSL